MTTTAGSRAGGPRHVRYGLIGSGMMGHEHIRNIALMEGASVALLADPDDGMRDSAQALSGAPLAVRTLQEAVAADACDAWLVASPNHTHAEVMRALLPTGKPILVEKPLATTTADCADLIARAKGAEDRIWVAMEYRYMPPLERLRAELAAGTAGRLRMIAIREHRYPFLAKVGDWNRFNANTGGTLVEKCCHFFDLMRLLAGSDPLRVYASGAMDVNFLDEDYQGRRPDILDNAFVIVDFAGGVRAMLDLCMFAEGAYWQETVTATGDTARLEARIPGPARFSADGQERTAEFAVASRASRTETRDPVHVDETILAAGDHHGSTFFQHRRFLDLVRNGGTPEVTLRDGAIAVAVGAAAEESARTGQPVAVTLP
jgi:myo-inositol 2-dehydrogenase / D-chiro-inositol 1-dehydrogenase